MVLVTVCVMMRVMMVVVVGMVVTVAARRASVPTQKEDDAEAGDRQAGGDAEPRVEPLGNDVARRVERHRAQQVDARRVRGRDDEAEHERVPGRSPRADEIGGHDGLAVPRLERVDRAEASGHDEGEQEDADPQRSRGHQLGERAARCRLQVRREPRRRECSRRHPRTRRGKERRCELAPERQARLDILRRAGEQIGRVVGQLVASVPVGDRRLDDRGIRSRHRDDLLPSGAIGKVRVAVVERRRGPEMSVERHPVADADLQRREPAGARREYDLSRGNLEREAMAVDLEREPFTERLRFAGGPGADARVIRLGDDPGLLDLLEGGDLRHVDDVAELDAVRAQAESRVAVDAEVAERMRQAGARKDHEARERQADQPSPPPRALSAHRPRPHALSLRPPPL